MRRTLILLTLVLFLIGIQPAWAHANLLRSDPAANATLSSAPQTITLWFTEPVEANFSSLILLDHQGNTLHTPPSAVDPGDPKQMSLTPGPLQDGIYTVSWRAFSAADGHSTRGSFAFSVGPSAGLAALAAPDTETIPLLSVLVRWFEIMALALAVGSVSFAVCVSCAPPQERRMRHLMKVSWVLVGLSAVVLLLYQAAQATNIGLIASLPALGTILLETRFGVLWIARMIVWGVFGVAIARRCYGIALAAGGTLLLLHALYSHASATYDLLASVTSDWLHLAATAFWVGGLIQFINVLISLRSDPQPLAPLVARFSNYARICVAALAVTGLYAAWLEVGSLEALLNTLYGRALLVKTILFAPLLGIAAVNLLLTSRGLRAGRVIWAKRLRSLVGAEIALTVGIFAAVAVMASADPARASLAQRLPAPNDRFSQTQMVSDLQIQFEVVPGWVGQNQFIVTLLDMGGNPIDDASLIRLRFDNQTQNVGESEVHPQHLGTGVYQISGANLSVPGQWRARVTVARPNQFDALTDFTLTMTNAPSPSGLDMSTPLSGHRWALLLAGLALLVIGGASAGRQHWSPLRDRGLLITATIITGTVLLVGAVI